MPKKHPIADQFSDDDMHLVKAMGQGMGAAPSDFDEEVERGLARLGEARRKKMRTAQQGLAPSPMETQAVQQQQAISQQASAQGSAQAAQAQAQQLPLQPPAAPAGPQGSQQPYPAQQQKPEPSASDSEDESEPSTS